MRSNSPRSRVGLSLDRLLAESQITQKDLSQRMTRSAAYTNQVMSGKKPASPAWVDLVSDVLELDRKDRGKLHQDAALDAGFKLEIDLS